MRFAQGIVFALSLLILTGPVPCEVTARQDAKPPAPLPAPQADVTPPALGIGGKLEVEQHRLVRLNVQGLPPNSGVDWQIEPLDDPKAELDWATPSDVPYIMFAATPGRYRVDLAVFSIEAGVPRLKRVKAVLTVQGPRPPPKVDPKVETLPVPKPKDESVGPVTGLRVIFVRESSDKTPATISAKAVRDYLNRKCAKGPKGQPEWRVYDPQQGFADTESPTMKAMWEASKSKLGTLPQMIVASDQRGQIYPLPDTDAEALTILKTYGGE